MSNKPGVTVYRVEGRIAPYWHGEWHTSRESAARELNRVADDDMRKTMYIREMAVDDPRHPGIIPLSPE